MFYFMNRFFNGIDFAHGGVFNTRKVSKFFGLHSFGFPKIN
jgi:hypothetical protein